MGPRIRSLDEPARAKYGRCKLCGTVDRLSKTHVPAQGAGNKGTARRPIDVLGDDGIRRYGLAREVEGGMWGRWFCEPCNNATGRWDKEYIRWVQDVFPALQDSRSTGDTLAACSDQLDSGAFVRCLWAWMFALADNLLDRYPELASAVRTGLPAAPPSDVRLVLAATRDLQFGLMAGHHSVIVTAPPFVAMLVTVRLLWVDHVSKGFYNTSLWLLQPAGQRGLVDFKIPVVHTFDEGELPPVGQPVID